MNSRSIGLLAVVTVITVVAAVTLTQRRDSATAATVSEAALFPELSGQINDAARVEVKSTEGAFTVAREGDGDWGLVEKDGYPVDQAKVRKLLIALTDARVLEPKTSRPELYGKLGLAGPEEADSPSVDLTVADASGMALASLVIGDRGQSRSRTAYYVRKKDDPQSYLVEADLRVDKGDSTWLAKEIVDVARDRVKAVRIEHGNGERIFVHKNDEAATDFVLEDIPEGKELRYAGAPGSLASGLARLTMEDVRAASETTLPESPTATTTFWTYDGLEVTARLYEVEEELLATFSAVYAEDVPGMPESAPDAEESSEEADDEAAPEDAVDAGPSPEEVTAEAEALVAKTTPWVYVLPSWKKSTLAKTLEEMTKDIEPPAEEAPTDAAAADMAADPAVQELLQPAGEAAENGAGEVPAEEGASEDAAGSGETAGSGHEGHDHADHDHSGDDPSGEEGDGGAADGGR